MKLSKASCMLMALYKLLLLITIFNHCVGVKTVKNLLRTGLSVPLVPISILTLHFQLILICIHGRTEQRGVAGVGWETHPRQPVPVASVMSRSALSLMLGSGVEPEEFHSPPLKLMPFPSSLNKLLLCIVSSQPSD